METKTSARMNRRILLLLSMASVFLIITAINANFNIHGKNEDASSAPKGEISSQIEEKTPSDAPATARLLPYTLREYQGIIGVFENGSTEPFLTVDVQVSSLPKTDAALLRQGITAESEAALLRLLEDYES